MRLRWCGAAWNVRGSSDVWSLEVPGWSTSVWVERLDGRETYFACERCGHEKNLPPEPDSPEPHYSPGIEK